MRELRRDRKLHIWDKPENVKKLVRGFFIFCAVLLALDFIPFQHSSFGEKYKDKNHNHQWDPGEEYKDANKNGQYDPSRFEGETWFGFYSVYGFMSCVVLVAVATVMRKFLMREENYYDR
jgi:hypothetical protein